MLANKDVYEFDLSPWKSYFIEDSPSTKSKIQKKNERGNKRDFMNHADY